MQPVRDASDGGGGCASATRDLLIGNRLINQSGHLQTLSHRVELIGGAEIFQERCHDLGVAQQREGGDELVKPLCRLGHGSRREYLATRHITMLSCYYAAMQLIPAIDLLGDFAVRLKQGDYDRVLFRKPIEDFMARIVATNPPLIHIVDLEGARDGELRRDVVRRCSLLAGTIPLQVSGGIRTLASARDALDAGASRIIVGTAVWSTSEALGEFVDAFNEQLVVAFDVRDGELSVRGWKASAGLGVDEALHRCVVAGVTRLHVTAIQRDGTMRGPDLGLYRHVCASGLKIVAAGGVRDDNDVAALERVGCEAAVMGLGYLRRIGLEVN